MNPSCAKCSKTVYPTEKLMCLDQAWHKGCFRCNSCSLALNMKTYKGYEKKPYCNAHYPKTKFTAVADTPESRRVQDNTKLQSNIRYHEDFEKMKGKKTSVTDDPESNRFKQNTQLSNVNYKGVRQSRETMESHRPNPLASDNSRFRKQPGSIHDYDPAAEESPSPYSGKQQATQIYHSKTGQESDEAPEVEALGEIEEPTALNVEEEPEEIPPMDNEPEEIPPMDNVENGSARRVGSIADYDPINEKYGATTSGQQAQQPQYYDPPVQSYQPPPQSYQPPPQSHQPEPFHQPPPAEPQQPMRQQPRNVYRAIYDYAAADDDEVSFSEGDLIINCEVIDSGWMSGTIQRSGAHGMLPSNYVEPV